MLNKSMFYPAQYYSAEKIQSGFTWNNAILHQALMVNQAISRQ